MNNESKNKRIIMPDIPADANLTDYITLEEEVEKLEARVKRLEEGINSGIQCLTSGNSINVSDPRPAIKYLKEALDE